MRVERNPSTESTDGVIAWKIRQTSRTVWDLHWKKKKRKEKKKRE